MLRDILNNEQKTVDATYKAHAEIKRGAVVTKGEDGVTAFVAQAQDDLKGVFLVDREPISEGKEASYLEAPEAEYDVIAQGKYVKLVKYYAGEQFATDQITGDIKKGEYVEVLTDGTIGKKATGTTGLICRGTVTDGVNTLHVVEVL